LFEKESGTSNHPLFAIIGEFPTMIIRALPVMVLIGKEPMNV